MPLRFLCALFLATSAVFAADEVLTDKSSSAKVLALYQKVLTAAQKEPPAPGGVICLGSSHMQYWKSVKEDLAPLTVHNFGIGGSRMNQAADLFVENLAIPFKPRAVILYEGSNDINAGDSAERVVARVEAYLAGLRKVCPDAALVILATTHAPSRRAKWDEMRKADAGFRRIDAATKGVAFVDINEALNFPGDEPRPGMYLKDDLHPTEAGYAAMLKVVRPAVDAAWKANAVAYGK